MWDIKLSFITVRNLFAKCHLDVAKESSAKFYLTSYQNRLYPANFFSSQTQKLVDERFDEVQGKIRNSFRQLVSKQVDQACDRNSLFGGNWRKEHE